MVFTISGMRDLREARQRRIGARQLVRPEASHVPRPGVRRLRHAGVCGTVGDYTGRCGWAVVPGARVARGGGPCSCGDAGCSRAGAHPLPFADEIPAGTSAAAAAEAWARVPGAAVLLPAGRSFDVIEVAEAPGRQAVVRLERMGLRLGPVLLTPDARAQVFVAPGAAAELPHLLYRMGWDDAQLDLRCLGPGDHVTAPPSDLGGLGPVRWLREPPQLGVPPQPPEARLLLGTLAYACHRERALA